MKESLELLELMRMAKRQESLLARIYRQAADNAFNPLLRKTLLLRRTQCEEGERQLSEWMSILDSYEGKKAQGARLKEAGDRRPLSPFIRPCFPAE
ncbi:MAG: hypothetical protein SWK76_09890 [Actinomycetota bacterium]|nr:hypothetical protein [Actinomycetota bacterium]